MQPERHSNLFADEGRICPPGDRARQFVVQRVITGPSLGPVPFVLWVHPQPVAMRHRDCKCSMSFTITSESVWQRMRRKSGSFFVCPCMGHFIE
jgi:hypothetical protein